MKTNLPKEVLELCEAAAKAKEESVERILGSSAGETAPVWAEKWSDMESKPPTVLIDSPLGVAELSAYQWRAFERVCEQKGITPYDRLAELIEEFVAVWEEGQA
jgi:hypothetical protein